MRTFEIRTHRDFMELPAYARDVVREFLLDKNTDEFVSIQAQVWLYADDTDEVILYGCYDMTESEFADYRGGLWLYEPKEEIVKNILG